MQSFPSFASDRALPSVNAISAARRLKTVICTARTAVHVREKNNSENSKKESLGPFKLMTVSNWEAMPPNFGIKEN